jgi:hypothetical protein
VTEHVSSPTFTSTSISYLLHTTPTGPHWHALRYTVWIQNIHELAALGQKAIAVYFAKITIDGTGDDDLDGSECEVVGWGQDPRTAAGASSSSSAAVAAAASSYWRFQPDEYYTVKLKRETTSNTNKKTPITATEASMAALAGSNTSSGAGVDSSSANDSPGSTAATASSRQNQQQHQHQYQQHQQQRRVLGRHLSVESMAGRWNGLGGSQRGEVRWLEEHYGIAFHVSVQDFMEYFSEATPR